MVGRVGIEPTTPAMSMQHSTNELTALVKKKYYFLLKIFVSTLIA